MSGVLAGRVAVVTGAGRGVGRAYAHALAAAGADVVVNDLADGAGASPAEIVADEIRATGGRAVASDASVAEFSGAAAMVETALDAFGRLDILVANAGIARPAVLHEADEGQWSDVLAVHANGTFNAYRHAVPHMIRGGGGSIITTGDLSTDLMFPLEAAYRAAKAAIAVFTLYAADELRPHGINVNSVMPGATDTRMMRTYFESLGDQREAFLAEVRARYKSEDTAGSQPATPESVPPLGVFLASESGREITGRLFTLKHSTIRLFTPSGEVGSLHRDDDERWTTDALSEAVPSWLDGLGTEQLVSS
jgi:NAD(P)-dependent dehydrogenase (short-subunit alcohol dehydrogenase family)